MDLSWIINAIICPFGYRRTVLGKWPHRNIVIAAKSEIEECGGTVAKVTGTPAGEIEVSQFQIGSSTIELQVVDYGEVILFGQRTLVREMATKINERLRGKDLSSR